MSSGCSKVPFATKEFSRRQCNEPPGGDVSTLRIIITEDQKQQYRDQGYFIIKRKLSDEHLELLRGGAQHAIAMVDRMMDEKKTDVLGINHRGKRYFSRDGLQRAARSFDSFFSAI